MTDKFIIEKEKAVRLAGGSEISVTVSVTAYQSEVIPAVTTAKNILKEFLEDDLGDDRTDRSGGETP